MKRFFFITAFTALVSALFWLNASASDGENKRAYFAAYFQSDKEGRSRGVYRTFLPREGKTHPDFEKTKDLSWIHDANCSQGEASEEKFAGECLVSCEADFSDDSLGDEILLHMQAKILYDECEKSPVAGIARFYKLDSASKLTKEVLGKDQKPYAESIWARVY